MNGLDKTVDKNPGPDQRADYPQKADYSKKAEGPVSYGWLPLGVGRGVKWTLWKTNVTFQRREKQGDNWLTTEEFHVAPKILKELMWRIPGWLDFIDKNDGRGAK